MFYNSLGCESDGDFFGIHSHEDNLALNLATVTDLVDRYFVLHYHIIGTYCIKNAVAATDKLTNSL